MSPIRNSADIDLYERERVGSENFESGAQMKKCLQLYFSCLDWRKADAWTLVYMWTVPGSIGIPSGLLEKKLWLIMCCHFFGPHFWLGKNSFVQKISKKNQAGTTFLISSRLDESLHWNPFTFGIGSRRFCKSRHSLISFWNSLTEWNPGFF